MITTTPVTMRVNSKIVNLAKAEARKPITVNGKPVKRGYQTVLNERLAKSFGVKLPELPNTRLAKPAKKAKTTRKKGVSMAAKAKPAAKGSKKPAPKKGMKKAY